MTSAGSIAVARNGILARLSAASTAEDFFILLGVTYDARIVNVARLHILKRMGQYIAREDFDGVPEGVVAARCKAMLERAYADFVTSSPLEQRVFKVLEDAVKPAVSAPAFVPFETLLK